MNKKYIKLVLDLFSIHHYYIRKGRPHGHRYGKKEGDQEYHTANQLQKKCKKREFLSIHDRFIRDERFRKSMIELGRTEEVIREMDKLANEDHTPPRYCRRTQCVPQQLVDTFEFCWFRHDAHKASAFARGGCLLPNQNVLERCFPHLCVVARPPTHLTVVAEGVCGNVCPISVLYLLLSQSSCCVTDAQTCPTCTQSLIQCTRVAQGSRTALRNKSFAHH